MQISLSLSTILLLTTIFLTMSHYDKEDNFPLPTSLEGMRKAEEEASTTQKPTGGRSGGGECVN
jgi:hypothetical protein